MGCIVVSSVAVLGGLALAFHIGTDAIQRGSTVTTTELPRTTTTVRATASVTADPAVQLFDGGETVLTSSDFPAGSEVELGLCLSDRTLTTGLDRACNERKVVTAAVDPSGKLEATLSVNISFEAADGTKVDCAATDGYCSASLVSTTDPKLFAQVRSSSIPPIRAESSTCPIEATGRGGGVGQAAGLVAGIFTRP